LLLFIFFSASCLFLNDLLSLPNNFFIVIKENIRLKAAPDNKSLDLKKIKNWSSSKKN
jgi:hypothetical protein